MLKGEGTSGTSHWQENTAVALTQGAVRQSMNLGARDTQGWWQQELTSSCCQGFRPESRPCTSLAGGVLCMGAGLCGEKEPLCSQSAGTQPILQMQRLVCIISSSKCVTLAEMAIFLTCHYGFLQCQWKSAGRGFACV